MGMTPLLAILTALVLLDLLILGLGVDSRQGRDRPSAFRLR